jgi:7,8-dihydropterin-6-yl-methyl-4-(beta-D-ribofuranosyl)aminobenzene 5'-phosphate synthase
MVKVERSGIGIFGGSAALAALNSQWGLSLYLETTAGDVTRRQMLDFGLTSEVLLNNLKLLDVDPGKLDGLILSHGHGDHFGGLVGFLERHRAAMKPDIALVVGGEDNFCWQYAKSPDGKFIEFGVLDRADLKRLQLPWSSAEQPRLIGDQAFSTGRIARDSIEKVLPNTFVGYGMHNGIGCDAGHFTEAERAGDIVPNQHWHEHATCFNLRGRGLVVISSCGHCGIINSVREAQRASGIAKVHAIIGGFHLYPAQAAYVADIVKGVKALEPDVLIPMHCSGVNFVAAAHELMPDQLVTSATGNRFTFGA